MHFIPAAYPELKYWEIVKKARNVDKTPGVGH